MLRDRHGFTVIEVLIALSIAGLILLAVFLAVPAMRRNARNYQRRNDVTIILGALSELISTTGKLPQGSCNNQHDWCWVLQPDLGFFDNSFTSPTNNVSYRHKSSPWAEDELAQDEIPEDEPAVSTFDPMFNHGYPYNRVSIRTYAKCDQSNFGHFSNAGANINNAAAQFL